MDQFKQFAREVNVNNKVVEMVPTKMYIRVSMYDEDRGDYVFSETFEIFEAAEEKYDELINIELEKMSHQF